MTKELEKEAEEYAEDMTKYYASTHEDCIPSQFEKYLRNAYISSAEPRDKRIAELKKTVLEISQHLDLTEREWGKDTTKLIHFKTQATKAKELLNEFLDFESSCMERGIYIFDKIRAEAEQFLKE